MADSVDKSIGRLEGKLDLVITSVSDLKKSFDALEAGRLSAVEKDLANLTGKLALIAGTISTVIPVAIEFIKAYFLK